MNHKAIAKSGGFTLIEVIAVLVLLGIIGTGVAMLLNRGIESYFMARVTDERSQQAQVALARIEKELLDMDGVTAWSPTGITYTRNGGTLRIVWPAGTTEIRMLQTAPAAIAQQPLVNHVTAFNLAYVNNAGGAWGVPQGFNALSRIVVTMTLAGHDGTALNFATTVNPRRTTVPNAPGLF